MSISVRHAEKGLMMVRDLKQKKNDNYLNHTNPKKSRNEDNFYKKTRTYASSQKHKQFECKETTCSVKNKYYIVCLKVLTHSPRMQCIEAPSPVMSIYNVPAAQHKIIDQRVIARPSKTSHQQRKQTVHVSIEHHIIIRHNQHKKVCHNMRVI